jgi:hypothetical protein
MLEVRETWKLSQPIISRCIPICISRNRSFRSERSYQIAEQLNLYKSNSEIDVKNMKLNDIIELRKKAYDPIHIIYSIVKEYGINNKDVLNIFKKIGAGYSPWIQLAYFLSALSSKTKDT